MVISNCTDLPRNSLASSATFGVFTLFVTRGVVQVTEHIAEFKVSVWGLGVWVTRFDFGFGVRDFSTKGRHERLLMKPTPATYRLSTQKLMRPQFRKL